jgi:hypothetical protein
VPRAMTLPHRAPRKQQRQRDALGLVARGTAASGRAVLGVCSANATMRALRESGSLSLKAIPINNCYDYDRRGLIV